MTYKLELFLVLQKIRFINIKSFKNYVFFFNGLLNLDSSFFYGLLNYVKCSPVSSMFNVKKLLNLIISSSLLYLVLCSIPYFHVLFYISLLVYIITQLP